MKAPVIMPARTRRQRNARRAVAYIEALAVSLMFALILACANRFGRTYRASIQAGQRARAAAWTQTVSGCDSRASDILPAAERLTARSRATATARLRAVVARAVVPTDPAERMRGLSSAASPGEQGRLGASVRFMCNELPAQQSLASSQAKRFMSDVLRARSEP